MAPHHTMRKYSSFRPNSKNWIQNLMRRVWAPELHGRLWWSDPERPEGEESTFIDFGERCRRLILHIFRQCILGNPHRCWKLSTKFTSWGYSMIERNKHLRTDAQKGYVRQSFARCWGNQRDTRKRLRVIKYKEDIAEGTEKGRCLYIATLDKFATLQVIKETLPNWVSVACKTRGT